MPSRRCFVVCVLVELALPGLLGSWALAQEAIAPALTASPPQQMPAYGAPAAQPYAYDTAPPIYPSTPYPSTSYPVAAPESVPAGEAVNQGSNNLAPIYKPYESPEAMTAALGAGSLPGERVLASDANYEWQLLPTGLMYPSYLAGNREPRMGTQLVHERNHGWIWDATVGGRVGLLRYGTTDDLHPQGWQLDVEGAAFPRLDLQHEEDLISADFRAGLISTERHGAFESKFGYYHLSSHLGDEYMIQHPGSSAARINYSRDCLIMGSAVYPSPDLRFYTEVGWAFHEDGGASPWELQFGVDYSSTEPTSILGSPFFAINAHLRQENDFGGNMTVQTGWQWRGRTGHLLRTGMQYFNGMSDQAQFYRSFEEQIGFGLWYDF
jgi:hypothetical protein